MEGLDLDSDLISDYTSALNDGRSWNSNRSGEFDRIYLGQPISSLPTIVVC